MSSKKPFQGSLETMPLPNILQWLSDSKKTGTLAFKIRDEEKRIFFQEGSIFSASSNLEKDRFGIVIIKKGYVTQEQVDVLLEEGKDTGKLLGIQCVEKGLIPEEDVKKILLDQTMAIIESLMHREEGTFQFQEGENGMGNLDQIPLSIALQELFFGSASTRHEWKRVYETLGSLESVPSAADIQPGNVQSLSEFMQLILSHCDGKNRIIDLFARIDRKDFEICKAIADLVEKKWLIIQDSDLADDSEYQERIWQVHIMMEQKRFLRASIYLDEITVLFPDRIDIVKSLQEKANTAITDDINSLLGDGKVVLYQKAGFDQTKITGKTFGPQEWFLLSRIDGRTTLKEICQMTGQPREKTLRALYILIDAGAIDIKGREKETRRNRQESVMKPTLTQSSAAQKRVKKSVTEGPDETRGDEISKNSDKEPMDIHQLDRIYKRYLKMNHYEILNVIATASPDEIRTEFVRLSRLYHPDMYDRENMDLDVQERLEELFSMVNHAYRIVSNLKSREKYNQELWVNTKSVSRRVKPLDERIAQMDKIVLKPKSDDTKSGKQATGKFRKATSNIDPKNDESGKTKKSGKKPAKQTDTKPLPKTDVKPEKESPKESTREQKHLDEGIQLFKDNKYKDALESFESTLKHNSRNPDAYYYMSRCQQRMGGKNLDDALNNIKRALILDKENPIYFCQIARVEMARSNHNAAEKYLKTALAWDSDSKEAKYLLERMRDSQQTGFFAKFKRKKK